MKKISLIFISLFLILSFESKSKTLTLSPSPADSLPSAYLGLSTGINNINGMLGFNAAYRLHDKLFIRGGVGIGSWGLKKTIGIKYDTKYRGGWSYCLGYSSSSGGKDIKINMELQSGVKKDVVVDYLQASTFNFSVVRSWMLGKSKNAFNLEFGYSLPMETSVWKVKDGSVISTNSVNALNAVTPGGIMIGLGFTFGLM